MDDIENEEVENEEVENKEETTSSEYRMSNEKMYLLVIKYSIPTILSMLVNALYIVVDRFYVGRLEGDLGTMGLAAIGASGPILNIGFALAQLIGIGTAASISIFLGSKNKEKATEIFNNAIILGFIFALIYSILGFYFAKDLLMLVGASENIIYYALPYVRINMAFYVVFMFLFSMNHSIRATGNPKVFAMIQLLGAILNMILDPIFIFVLGLGISGAAVATVLSQIISVIFIFIYYFNGKSVLKITPKLFRLKFNTCKRIIFMGIAPFIMSISGSVVMSIVNHQLRTYSYLEFGVGDIAISAMTIINSIMILLFMPIIGINQGVQPIIGYNYGNRNYKRCKEAYKWGLLYSTAIATIGVIVIFSFTDNIVRIFNSDPLLLKITSEGMRIFLFALPLAAVQVSSANFFQAVGKVRATLFLSALRQIILLIPLFYIMPRIFGFRGIWMAAPTADIIAATITLCFIWNEFRTGKFKAAS